MTGFSFAHVSDLHLPLTERPPRLRDLLSKRFFSWLSWRFSRRHIHRPEVLAALAADVAANGADHMIVTGDLTNLVLPDECVRARDWLAAKGDASALTVIPGNHDALVPVAWDRGPGLWREWMDGADDWSAFPFVKRMGEAALIGVSSAVPTPPFMASGAVGHEQLTRLEDTLAVLGAQGVFRVVLIHHPITDGAVSSRKALTDQAELRAVLARAGCELVLHGHSHHATTLSVEGPSGPIPVIGAPSASSAPDAHGEPAGWRRIVLEPSNEAWRLRVSTRRMGADGAFSENLDFELEVARPSVATPRT